MTITSTTVRTTIEDGGTAFATGFKFIRDADLRVSVLDADGAETVKTISTHYTVTGAGLDAGGTVTFGSAVAETDTVLIINDPALTQLTDYTSGDPFPANSHEAALDLLTIQQQRTRDMQVTSSADLVIDNGTVKLSGLYPVGSNNVALGTKALGSIAADAASNVAVGMKAGFALTTEDQNVIVGTQAGQHIVHGGGAGVGDNNTLVGHQSGMGATTTNRATDNTAVGSCSLETITTGTHNSFVGRRAGFTLTTGTYNVGNGYDAGDHITTGTGNIFIGAQAGKGVQTGDYNVCLGYKAGDKNVDGGGDDVAHDGLGSNKLVIHSDSDGTLTPATEALVYGDFSAGTLKINSGHTSNDALTVNSTNATYTGDLLKLTTTDAADANFDFIKADANSANQFRVSGVGVVYAQNTTVQSADYADMFEWADGNPDDEDRIGLSVVLDGQGGIRCSTESDAAEDVIGAVSGTACIVGNSAWNNWDQQFLKDDFGRTTDELNPDFDESMEYVPRQERQEWAIIGLTGRIHLRTGSKTHPSWRKIRTVSAVTEEWLVR